MPLVNAYIGVSQKENLIEAAKEAAQESKNELGSKKPKLLMFFCVFTYDKKDYKQALEAIYNVFEDEDIPLVGGSVLGFFAKDKYYFDVNMLGKVSGAFLKGAGKIIPSFKFNGVVVLALESDYLNVGTGLGLNAFKEPEKAGRDSITQALNSLEYNPSVAYLAMMEKGAKDITRFRPINGFLLTPGIEPSRQILLDQEILNGIVSLTKRTVRLAGGGMSSGMSGRITIGGPVFYNDNSYEEAVVSIVFGSDLEIGYGLASGAKALPQRAVITKSKGHVIYELNNRPALDVLREFFEQCTDKKIKDFIDFYLYLIVQGYTLGFTDIKGDFYWPFIGTKIIDGKGLSSLIPVKEGLGISLIKITEKSAQEATAEAARIMTEDTQTKDFGFVLFASCAVRGQVLGKKYLKEVEVIKRTLNQKELPILGICSNGEQGFYETGPMVAGCFLISMMGISNRLISEIRK